MLYVARELQTYFRSTLLSLGKIPSPFGGKEATTENTSAVRRLRCMRNSQLFYVDVLLTKSSFVCYIVH